jgi:hypothetical protein
MDYAEIKLSNSAVFTVEGTLEEVEKKLSDAAIRPIPPRLVHGARHR